MSDTDPVGRVDAAEAAAEVELGVTSGVSHAWRALRHRNFRLFLSGQFLSLIGTWVQNIAQSWLVYRLTGSAVMLGLVGFAGQIPYLLLSPSAGWCGR